MANEITKDNLMSLCAFAALGGRCIAPRPGSNIMAEVEFGGPGLVTVSGAQMEALHRAGYLTADPVEAQKVLADDEVRGEVRADHEWMIAPVGWAVVNHLIDNYQRRPKNVVVDPSSI